MNLNSIKKGQTALEYLMTYGWAILIVVIVVGALYALGLTEPCKWTGTQIREFADFRVENPQFDAAGTSLAFDVSRLKPDTVTLDTIDVTGDATGSSAPAASLGSTAQRFTVTGLTTTVAAGDCFSANVALDYNVTTAGGATTFTSTGVISGVAQ